MTTKNSWRVASLKDSEIITNNLRPFSNTYENIPHIKDLDLS